TCCYAVTQVACQGGLADTSGSAEHNELWRTIPCKLPCVENLVDDRLSTSRQETRFDSGLRERILNFFGFIPRFHHGSTLKRIKIERLAQRLHNRPMGEDPITGIGHIALIV